MIAIPGTKEKHAHNWAFCRVGGVDQVVFRDADDLVRIGQLDLKLWMALAVPTTGLEFDPVTARLLDTDNDGRIRPPELIAAIRWADTMFKDLGGLMKSGTTVALAAIKDAAVLSAVKRVLTDLDKADASEISIDDISVHAKTFLKNKFNGDGVVVVELAGDETTRKAIENVLETMGGVEDRSGKQGIDQTIVDAFFTQTALLLKWADAAHADQARTPLGLDATLEALTAVKAVKGKVDDYFARCRLVAFDARAMAALNREDKEYLALADKDLTINAQEIACLPLARIAPAKPLPLDTSVNPAWSAAIAALTVKAVAPLLGAGRTTLTEEEWNGLQARLAPFEALLAAKPATKVEGLGMARLRELSAGPAHTAINSLIQQDLSLAKDYAHLAIVEKLVRFQRDLYELITNFVNFADFYGRTWSVFQAGTLYFDARACDLCIEVADSSKHAMLAGLSGAFLAYCDVTRQGGLKKTIVVVVTDGDSDNLMVGRNGVFYDRKGQDWDATITKIVANSISIREAFWMPYKKFARFIEDQVAKRAQSAEQDSQAKMSETAKKATTADKTKLDKPPQKLDLGTIALIGTAIGGISALVGGFLQSLFGLGLWLPLGLAGLIMLISGPSMILAWLKLRQRNLAPILDANGWAINTRARMNAPFGRSLTQLSRLPKGAKHLLNDPFAEKKQPWKLYVVLLAMLALAYCWWIGKLDAYLPKAARQSVVFPPQASAPAPDSAEKQAP